MRMWRLVMALIGAFGLCGAVQASGTRTPDYDPKYDLAPGMSFSCRVRVGRLSELPSGTPLVSRAWSGPGGGYHLRVNPTREGGTFVFFTNLDGTREPRVACGPQVVTGRWYEVSAGWDGTNVFLNVDGVRRMVRRPGRWEGRIAPLEFGDGCEIADFDFHAAPRQPEDDTSLQPGFRLHCAVTFDTQPTGMTELVARRGEYLLRYDVRADGTTGDLCFWPAVGGRLEPRVSVPLTVVTGRTYEVAANWDGTMANLWVDGQTAHRDRSGTGISKGAEIRVAAGKPTRVEDLLIRTLHVPNVFVAAAQSTELMPRQGEPTKIKGELLNIGAAVRNCRLVVTPQPRMKVWPTEIPISDLPPNQPVPFSLTIDAGEEPMAAAEVALYCGTRRLAQKYLGFALRPREEVDRCAGRWNPPIQPTRTWYVDSVRGNDAADGRTPGTALRTLASVRGRTLGPGERLLLKRGSVFDEELMMTAAGAATNWAEIGAYGEGPRPQIRRRKDIDERCALIHNPTYLAIRDLIVCNAGKGLVVQCDKRGSGHVLMERCLAHHIEGLYRFNSHGIPEWRDRRGAPRGRKGGLVIAGYGTVDATMRDCEMYQCSNGFMVMGADVWLGRLFCHDNICPNTSPHPFLVDTQRSALVDSILDAAGWNASCGTMSIMFGNNQGLVVRGCHFVNMADSGSGDGGCIDFEAYGDNCRIEECTFANNAGAAIEVLGLSSPQAHNTHIRNCRFFKNNWSHKLGPSEIYIHGLGRDRRVECASGLVEHNGYVLAEGVSFFTNVSTQCVADWTVRENTRYGSWQEMTQAMPFNEPPQVEAGEELWTDTPEVVLDGRVSDERVGNSAPVVSWEQFEGPDVVRFSDANQAETKANLPACGDYRLLLKADDGQYWRTARTAIHRLAPGLRLVRAWTFSKNHDQEGWRYEGLGTQREIFNVGQSDYTFADPVNEVCGDYLVLAMKASTTACITSPDLSGLVLSPGVRLVLRLQNHTDSAAFRLGCEILDERGETRTEVQAFATRAHDDFDRVYTVPLAFTGRLQRLKIDFSTDGSPVTGTCRIDYLAVLGSK